MKQFGSEAVVRGAKRCQSLVLTMTNFALLIKALAQLVAAFVKLIGAIRPRN